MCRPLQTIKRKGGGTSLLKESLLKQSQESSYDPTPLRSNVLAFYLRRWVFIRRTWFGESCAATVVIHRDVSQRRYLRGAGTQERLTVSWRIFQSYRDPTYLPLQAASSFEAQSWQRRGRRELRRHKSNALCWQLEEADSNECLHNCSLSCSTPADHMCFRSWLINKHFSRYGCLPPGDLLLHLFSLLLSPAQKK